MSKLSSEKLKYIIARVIDNANDTLKEPSSSFNEGKKLAYYEILDTIKNELIVSDVDLKEFGLDIDLENTFI